ncbi:MAG: HNH endonuclease [Deltaproteobacteria bacterium]|nr:HNH endonuclease [Deltaproteobacteria bacterium]
MLSSQVLVLNRSFMPINITSVRRAFILLYQGLAKAVDPQFETFDFQSWSDLSIASHHEAIGLINRWIRVPRVILLSTYDRVPRRHVRFSRHNIYLRDANTCQFCGRHFSRSDLNLDHVIPRSQGGKTNWENVVTSCIPCNRRKGVHSPLEVGMKLIRHPVRPRWTPFMDMSLKEVRYAEWKPFFNIVDFSYWNLELQQE